MKKMLSHLLVFCCMLGLSSFSVAQSHSQPSSPIYTKAVTPDGTFVCCVTPDLGSTAPVLWVRNSCKGIPANFSKSTPAANCAHSLCCSASTDVYYSETAGFYRFGYMDHPRDYKFS